MSTTPTVSTPAAPAAVTSNPFTWLTDFIGSANVQKTLAGIQVAVAATTGAEGQTLGTKIAGMSVGAVYGLAVHYIDYLRTKI